MNKRFDKRLNFTSSAAKEDMSPTMFNALLLIVVILFVITGMIWFQEQRITSLNEELLETRLEINRLYEKKQLKENACECEEEVKPNPDSFLHL